MLPKDPGLATAGTSPCVYLGPGSFGSIGMLVCLNFEGASPNLQVAVQAFKEESQLWQGLDPLEAYECLCV